jgi:non-ribosomal peptide synthetase component F
LPLDGEHPVERLEYMLGDTGASVLLVSEQYTSKVTFQGTVLNLSTAETYAGSGADLAVINQPSDLAYIIYTSGSTGKPKGVMVEHRQVQRLMAGTQGWYGFNGEDVWTLFHTYAFDFSVWELWGALLYGGS